jgi:acetyl esterase/lipase
MTVTAYRDVVFSRPPGCRPLSLDLYIPDGPARALCLYLHGGGWRAGSRADGPGPARDWTPSFFERVAGLGVAMASLDYRLSGEARWPAQLEDVQAAATFLSLQRKPLGVPTPRTVAWGVSAGGQLAAMHALRSPGAGLDAVVCWYPPTDLDALAGDCDAAGGRGDRGPQARESRLIGAPLDERPDLAAAASPVRFAHPGAPPFLFVHGTADTLVPPRQSRRLAEALTEAGAQATVELVDGATHMFPELDEAATTTVMQRSVRFLCDTRRELPSHAA